MSAAGRRKFAGLLLTLPLLALSVAPANAAPPSSSDGSSNSRERGLPDALLRAMQRERIPTSALGLAIYPVDGKRAAIAHNEDRPLNPASLMKLLTTYAALERLGPSYSFRTELLTEQPVLDRRLAGNLYLRGSGDPKLALGEFWMLLRELRARGLQHIDGDLIIDRSLFTETPHDAAAFDGKPLRPYNQAADAALVNFGAIRLGLSPDTVSGKVRVWQQSPDARLIVDNQLQLALNYCGDWRERLAATVTGWKITLTGELAADCGEKMLNLAPYTGDEQVAGLFTTLWAELGGSFNGAVRAGAAPEGASPRVVAESAPLADLVRDANKYSNNVMAQHMFLALSPDTPASEAQARAELETFMRDKNLSARGVTIDNGSGLSRNVRMPADFLRKLLQSAWQSSVMPEFVASLPVLGRDGTAKKRLPESDVAGRAHLKTGSLEGVRALAGYLHTLSGRRYVFVAVVNHPRASALQPCIDSLIENFIRRERAPGRC